MCEKNPDFRVGRYETSKGGTAIGRRCLTLGDRGFMAGRGRVSRCSLQCTSRGSRSRVTLAFLWGRGAASLAGRKRLQPQHTRREGRSNLYVPQKRPGSGRTRSASPDSAARSASLLRLERPSNDEAPKRTWQLPHRGFGGGARAPDARRKCTTSSPRRRSPPYSKMTIEEVLLIII